MKVLIILESLFSGYVALACPDFSGTYHKVMQQGDDRKTIVWTIKQNGCDSYDNVNQVIFKDGSKTDKVQFKRVIDGTIAYWDANKLFTFQKDANTEHCDMRGYLEHDQKKNLRYSWRFECPSPRGTSPWFTPETTSGWTGELYLKQ